MSEPAANLAHVAPDLRPLVRPVSSLKEDPKNARRHPAANLEAITASLRAHGQRKPIVVREGVVLAGNGTLAAARRLGWTHLACVEYEGPEALARAYAIADNRSAEGAEWEGELLAQALKEADAAGLLDATGFVRTDADQAIAAALAEATGAVPDPGPEEPPADPVSRRGEIYKLGQHRLLCGDSTSEEDVRRLVGGEKAALMATDPPYLVDYTGADRPDDSGKDWSHVYKEVEIQDAERFYRAVFRNALLVCREDAAFYVWHAHRRAHVIQRLWEELGILDHQQIVWVKPAALHGHSFWPYQHEPCLMGWQRGKKPRHDGDNSHVVTSVWAVDYDGKGRIVGNSHPTQKPLELFARPILKHTLPGEVVFEPFSGSGTQLLAAAKLGRRCYAIEIEPAFCDVARRRFTKWARGAGQDPGEGALE
jgi:DNA modification methylase